MGSANALLRFLRVRIAIPDRVAPKNRRVFAISFLGFPLAVALHLGFLVLFGLLRIQVLFYINIASIAVYPVAAVLVWRERYQAGEYIVCAEIIIHQALCVFLIGWQAGFQYYIFYAILIPCLLALLGRRGALAAAVTSVVCLPALYIASRFVTPVYEISHNLLGWISGVNLLIACVGVAAFAYYFSRAVDQAEDAAEASFQRAEGLLHNILPDKVAEELSLHGASRPVRVESATILFSDFVGFSRVTRGIDPVSVVSYLNNYFSAFDAIAQQHNVERLKTIGDGYMCAGGIPEANRTHPVDVCMAALGMLDSVRKAIQNAEGISWDVRIGINTGSVTAGIVGKAKFSYDIWGEAVNLASRHESSGIEGGINVSKCTYLLTKGFFDYKKRGEVEIKGGEKMEMYELLGVKAGFRGGDGLNDLYHETYGKIARGELLLGYDV